MKKFSNKYVFNIILVITVFLTIVFTLFKLPNIAMGILSLAFISGAYILGQYFEKHNIPILLRIILGLLLGLIVFIIALFVIYGYAER